MMNLRDFWTHNFTIYPVFKKKGDVVLTKKEDWDNSILIG